MTKTDDRGQRYRRMMGLVIRSIVFLAVAALPAEVMLRFGDAHYRELPPMLLLPFALLVGMGFLLLGAAWGQVVARRPWEVKGYTLIAAFATLPESLPPLLSILYHRGIEVPDRLWSLLLSWQEASQWPGLLAHAWGLGGSLQWRYEESLIDPPIASSLVNITHLVGLNMVIYFVLFRVFLALFAKFGDRLP